MSWRVACPGCTQGDHTQHVRDWNIRPGLIGGAWCDCPGEPECSARFAEFAERLMRDLGFPSCSEGDRTVSSENPPWATVGESLWFGQCRARREPRGRRSYFGRCELRRGHSGPHALDRGMDTPRWSTDWTSS